MKIVDEVNVIQVEPLTLVLKRPDGCTSGSHEAAEAFAESIAALRKGYPGRKFQLLPFSYRTCANGVDPALDAILAIAD